MPERTSPTTQNKIGLNRWIKNEMSVNLTRHYGIWIFNKFLFFLLAFKNN